MAVDVDIDVALLTTEIRKTYAGSEQPFRDFIFPTGRAWAEDLGYPPELANVPDRAVESFAGVANLWRLGRLGRGERARPRLGLAKARAAPAKMEATNVEFVGGDAERLPFPIRSSTP